MEKSILVHEKNDIRIAEISAEGVLIKNAQDGLDVLMDCYYQNFDKLILHEKNITPDFFDLSSGLAGEMLQKFSNYRVQLSIVGTFSAYTSKSLRDFMVESNRKGQITFVDSLEAAKERLLK